MPKMPGSEKAPSKRSRTLDFPKEHSIGSLFLIRSDFGGTRDLESAQLVGTARETVTVDVPEDKVLLLDFNRYALTHPELVEQSSGKGIDAVKVSFRAILENDVTCKNLLEKISHFKDLLYADLDHSDATDEPLSHWNLPKLRCIHVLLGHLEGSCFEQLATTSPQMDTLLLEYNPLKQTNFSYLTKMRALRRLNLSHTGLSEEGMNYIGKCHRLADLDLSDNRKISDDCTKLMVDLKHLSNLRLHKTSITVAGLKTLSALPLKSLVLPRSVYAASEMSDLHRYFPHTKISLDTSDQLTQEHMNWVYRTKFAK